MFQHNALWRANETDRNLGWWKVLQARRAISLTSKWGQWPFQRTNIWAIKIHKADLGSFWEDSPKWNHDPGFSASWKTPWLSLYFLPQLSATHGNRNRPCFSRANPDPTKVTRHSLRNRPCFKLKKTILRQSGLGKQFPESLQRAECITEVCIAAPRPAPQCQCRAQAHKMLMWQYENILVGSTVIHSLNVPQD